MWQPDDWDEYDPLADLELERAASSTLHLLYPDLYEEPVEKHDPAVDLSMYVAKGCPGEKWEGSTRKASEPHY